MRPLANIHHLSNFRLKKFAVSALLLGLVGTVTFASVHWIRTSLARKTPEATTITQPVESRNTLEMQRITLRPTGFEPAEVTRPAGRFLLAINDRSGQSDTSFILMRITGERLKEVRMRDTPRKHEWREVVNLAPGQYLLSEAANPERVCQILLTN